MPPSSFDLSGKVAIVTGAASGLGQAIAMGLARAGVRVCVADLNGPAAQATVAAIGREGESWAEVLDVTNRAAVERCVASVVALHNSVDVLVNSAGLAIRGTALDYPESNWDRIIAVNLKGTFLCCQAAARVMAAQGKGKIINLASIGASIAYPGSIAYLASKGGVAQLTKGFAVELASFNVQVNAIAPSLFDTPMVRGTRSDESSLRYFLDRTPAGRLGKPEEVVGAAIFLASSASDMVTGHTLAVDGGFLAA